jgi:hypothetical protein
MTGLRELAVGETADNLPIVRARNSWNSTGLKLIAGQSYEFEVRDVEDWVDFYVASDPQVGHIRPQPWMYFFKWLRRHRKENWYTFVGTAGKNPIKYFLIGGGSTHTIETTGELLTFANDAHGFYWNNRGTLCLIVIRLS